MDPQVLGCLYSYWCQCCSQFGLSCNLSTFSIPWLSLGSVKLNRGDICKENQIRIIHAPCQFATNQWLTSTVVRALLVLYRSKYNLLICLVLFLSATDYSWCLYCSFSFLLIGNPCILFYIVNSVFGMYLTSNWVSFNQDNWKIQVQSYSLFSVCVFLGT